MRLKCNQCGHIKDVPEQELMYNTECGLCGGNMLFEASADYLEREKELRTESEGIHEQIDNQAINTMISELKEFGEEKIWKEINSSDLEVRLLILPIFIEAKRKIKEEEK